MTALSRIAVPGLALTLWGLVVLLVGAVVGVGEGAGQGLNHAGLVLAFPDGRVERYCVQFEEDEISGAELLRRSGVSVVFSGSGGLGEGVCRIDDTGCSDPGDCFCQCSGGDCAYWSYFALNDDGEWRFQNVGASQRMLRNGDVDGWVWGSGSAPPPPAELAGACAQDEPEPPPAPPAGPTEAVAPDMPANSPPMEDPGGNEPDSEEPDPARRDSVVSEPPAPTIDASRDDLRRSDEGEPTAVAERLEAEDEGGSGPPGGLIAFGIVAASAVVIVGGLALRRRVRG